MSGEVLDIAPGIACQIGDEYEPTKYWSTNGRITKAKKPPKFGIVCDSEKAAIAVRDHFISKGVATGVGDPFSMLFDEVNRRAIEFGLPEVRVFNIHFDVVDQWTVTQ